MVDRVEYSILLNLSFHERCEMRSRADDDRDIDFNNAVNSLEMKAILSLGVTYQQVTSAEDHHVMSPCLCFHILTRKTRPIALATMPLYFGNKQTGQAFAMRDQLTYKRAIPKMNNRPIFFLFFICKRDRAGIGKTKM